MNLMINKKILVDIKDILSSKIKGQEIDEAVIELYRKYREFFVKLYPWRFIGDGE